MWYKHPFAKWFLSNTKLCVCVWGDHERRRQQADLEQKRRRQAEFENQRQREREMLELKKREEEKRQEEDRKKWISSEKVVRKPTILDIKASK